MTARLTLEKKTITNTSSDSAGFPSRPWHQLTLSRDMRVFLGSREADRCASPPAQNLRLGFTIYRLVSFGRERKVNYQSIEI